MCVYVCVWSMDGDDKNLGCRRKELSVQIVANKIQLCSIIGLK